MYSINLGSKGMAPLSKFGNLPTFSHPSPPLGQKPTVLENVYDMDNLDMDSCMGSLHKCEFNKNINQIEDNYFVDKLQDINVL